METPIEASAAYARRCIRVGHTDVNAAHCVAETGESLGRFERQQDITVVVLKHPRIETSRYLERPVTGYETTNRCVEFAAS